MGLDSSEPFTYDEVWAVIESKRDSTPGLYWISYSMILNLPLGGVYSFLVGLFNDILSGIKTVPREWKTSIIPLIPKIGRLPDLVSSYRPIGMSSCIGKVFESLIKNRLKWYVESRGILNKHQERQGH